MRIRLYDSKSLFTDIFICLLKSDEAYWTVWIKLFPVVNYVLTRELFFSFCKQKLEPIKIVNVLKIENRLAMGKLKMKTELKVSTVNKTVEGYFAAVFEQSTSKNPHMSIATWYFSR